MNHQETKADRLAILVASIAHAQAALTQAETCIRRIDHHAAGTFKSDTPRIVAGRVTELVSALDHLKRNVAQVMHAHAIAQGVQETGDLPEPEPFDLEGLDGPDPDEMIEAGERAVDEIENARDTEGRA